MKKLVSNVVTLSLLMAGALTSCQQQQESDPLISHIDSSVRPQDDFFEFANGAWFKQNPIPASETSNGIFVTVGDTVDAQVYNICLEAMEAGAPEGSNMQKIGDLYFSGMDSVTINQNGIKDLQPDLAKIDAVKNLKELPAMVAYVSTISGSPMFRFGIGQDTKNSSKNTASLAQGGLSMPDRRYYVENDANAQEIRAKFVEYAQGIFQTLGYDEAKAKVSAQQLLAVETSLAQASRKREDLRDPYENYHPLPFKEVQKLTPDFDFTAYLKELGLEKVDTIDVGQPEFFTTLNKTLKQYSIDTWKDYLKFKYINGLTSYLDDKTYMLSFNFFSKALNGVEEPRPRWKRTVSITNSILGDLIGQEYVAKYLPAGTKEKFVEIGKNIRETFAEHIRALDWMSDATKEKALQKLEAVNMKLAYPDEWKDLSALKITRNSFVQNAINASKWSTARMIERYGKPVDRTEWHMQPHTYNAYYSPSNNEICIPGCNIIVPGFEGRMPDDAVLYAIIGGSTFGHEVSHGFDDEGSQFDAEGNLSNWWSEEDRAKFEAKTQQIIDQFNSYEVQPGLFINGALTAGENIGDLGGLMVGLDAFKKTEQYKNNVIIGGYTPLQRFFLGHAQAWMVQMRPEALAMRVKSNEHSPAKWRVWGPLQDCDAFFEAWDVKEGDGMWRAPEDRVKIW
ncbi:MAG: M13 family metallopeptidase [Bacteroidales bacterium]|nr:M13 family metallopeptidase [Bacteroidales bacterium]